MSSEYEHWRPIELKTNGFGILNILKWKTFEMWQNKEIRPLTWYRLYKQKTESQVLCWYDQVIGDFNLLLFGHT
nr:hypothetical protein [Mycoplasmopsis bovis]